MGQPARLQEIDTRYRRPELNGTERPLEINREKIRNIAERYLVPVNQAAEIYRYIESKKAADSFITEVSLDETDEPQTPEELLFILAAIGDKRIPVQTIPPNLQVGSTKGWIIRAMLNSSTENSTKISV